MAFASDPSSTSFSSDGDGTTISSIISTTIEAISNDPGSIVVAATSTIARTTTTEVSFLGVGLTGWITMIAVLAGVIFVGLLLALICCLCCTASEEATQEQLRRRRNAANNSVSTTSTRTTPACPEKVETVVEKHTNHLPDGRSLTTITSVRTTTDSNGSKKRNYHRSRHINSQPSRGRTPLPLRRQPSAGVTDQGVGGGATIVEMPQETAGPYPEAIYPATASSVAHPSIHGSALTSNRPISRRSNYGSSQLQF